MLRRSYTMLTLTAALLGIAMGTGCRIEAEWVKPLTLTARADVEPQRLLPKFDEPNQPKVRTARATQPAARVTQGLALFGDRPDLERVPFENRLVPNLTRHSFTSEGLDFDPDVYYDDGVIVYASTRNSEHPDIYLKKIDGVTITQLTGDPADDIQPRISPDGQQVVFASNRGGTWDIWLMNRDSTGLMQLTRDGPDEVAPCWSPDGSQIAYTLWGDRSHRWEIWSLSVEQPGTRRFLAYGMFPVWSPDGSKLAFQRARQRGSRMFSIWTITFVDGDVRFPTEVAHSDVAACIAPSWSPDGSMIVYCAVQEGQRAETRDRSTSPGADLWVVELSSGMRMKLTDGADAHFNPIWADNGRIFFVSPRSGTDNIWSLAMATEAYPGQSEGSPRLSQKTAKRDGVVATE